MTRLVLEHWEPTVQVVSLIELIRAIRQGSLLAAKREVESFLDGQPITIDALSEQKAIELRAKLHELGVQVSCVADCE